MILVGLVVACAGAPNPTGLAPEQPLSTLAAPTAIPSPLDSDRLITPSDLVYLGAFRLPDGPEEIGWAWAGEALTYFPGGDPEGGDDGFRGSLFGTGHNWNQWVSEVSIPVPVVSPDKNLDELNTAVTLQEFGNIRGDLFEHLDFEIPRAGLEYLPEGEGPAGRLYFCWGQHLQEGGPWPSHGWCELNLADPQPVGAWYVGDYANYSTTDYLFAIPQAWADAHTPGRLLATGRFRDGGWGGQGPSLFAYGTGAGEPPPQPGSRLQATPLLLYDSSHTETAQAHTMVDYHHADEWAGGAWLTAGAKAAVIFVGTKGLGACWYGNPDGPCLDCEDRGWWSDRFVGQILFYDPADLAAVADGGTETWRPQPYGRLDIDPTLYHVESSQQKHHVGAAAFNRGQGLLYLLEPLADGDKPLVHVWQVTASTE
jgi:hypothetical protein